MTGDLNSDVAGEFKRAMRRLSATVNLITTEHHGVRYGMVATAVCSLGVSPPSLLCCISSTSSIHDPLLERGWLAINLLREEHGGLVGIFSGQVKGEARFENGEWLRHKNGLPMLAGAQASLICRVSRTMPYASHTVVISEVEDVHVYDQIDPLLYQNGKCVGTRALA